MTAATWGQVHVGDTVRGQNGRDYRISAVERLGTWAGSGQLELLVSLDVPPGEVVALSRPIVLRRGVHEPAPLSARADHTDMVNAFATLLALDMNPQLLSEETMTQSETLTDPAPRKEPPFGRYGWYKLPNPAWGEPGDPTEVLYPRVSTIKKTLSDEFGLTNWKLRMAVKGVSLRPDLIAKAAASDVDADKSTLDQIVVAAMEKAESSAAANYGTALHKFIERHSAGESIASMGVPGNLVADVEAYAAALKAHGLTAVPELSERTVVNDELEYAGTWDQPVRDRAGNLYILDVKTGKDLSYAWLENAVQLAMYVHCRWMCSRDFASYEPMPAIDQIKGLILHLPIGSGKAQIYGVPLDKGWRAATAAIAVRKMRAEAKSWNWLVKPEEPADVVRLHLDRAETLEALLEIRENADKRGLWTDELMAYALGRYDLIRVRNATREQLPELYAELHPVGRWTAELQEAGMARMSQLTTA